jgi:hypothetical protein
MQNILWLTYWSLLTESMKDKVENEFIFKTPIKWSEVYRSVVKWSEVQCSEVKWSEVWWSEVQWSCRKFKRAKNQTGEKWSEIG